MTLVVQIEELGLLEAPMLGVTCLEELIERLPLLRLVSYIENWTRIFFFICFTYMKITTKIPHPRTLECNV